MPGSDGGKPRSGRKASPPDAASGRMEAIRPRGSQESRMLAGWPRVRAESVLVARRTDGPLLAPSAAMSAGFHIRPSHSALAVGIRQPEHDRPSLERRSGFWDQIIEQSDRKNAGRLT